jgi:hypothetical protein
MNQNARMSHVPLTFTLLIIIIYFIEFNLDGKGVIACMITIPKYCLGRVAFEREMMVNEKK